MKLRIKEEISSPTVDVGEGEYRRRFARTDEPFEVSEEEWALLRRKDLFELVVEAGAESSQDSDSSSVNNGGESNAEKTEETDQKESKHGRRTRAATEIRPEQNPAD